MTKIALKQETETALFHIAQVLVANLEQLGAGRWLNRDIEISHEDVREEKGPCDGSRLEERRYRVTGVWRTGPFGVRSYHMIQATFRVQQRKKPGVFYAGTPTTLHFFCFQVRWTNENRWEECGEGQRRDLVISFDEHGEPVGPLKQE